MTATPPRQMRMDRKSRIKCFLPYILCVGLAIFLTSLFYRQSPVEQIIRRISVYSQEMIRDTWYEDYRKSFIAEEYAPLAEKVFSFSSTSFFSLPEDPTVTFRLFFAEVESGLICSIFIFTHKRVFWNRKNMFVKSVDDVGGIIAALRDILQDVAITGVRSPDEYGDF